MRFHRFEKRRDGRASRKGNVAVLVGVMSAFIAGLTAFSIDVGYVAKTKGQLRAAADAAALAGAGALGELNGSPQQEAINYALMNVPERYGEVVNNSSVTLGQWEPATKTFTATNVEPNAIRVVLERSVARGNAVPRFFGRVFGSGSSDLSVQSIAVGAVPNSDWANPDSTVYVTSTKDLSNVVLEFADGTHQKFDSLSGYSGTFSGDNGEAIVGVWIKSGCNHSNDGPGYGEYLAHPGDQSTVHGQPGGGCTPHVTATFNSTGVAFENTGSDSPVRLVF